MGENLGCGARALKFCLFLFNLVFLVCGFVCMGIGIWLILDKYAVDNLSIATSKVQGYEKDDGLRELATKPTAVRQIGYLLLCGGLVVIVVAFLGCCGAAKEWRPLLCCYATFLMIILATEIAAGLYGKLFHASLKMYNGTDSQRIRDEEGLLVKTAWDKFMQERKCCGVDSRKGEFNDSGWFQLTGKRYDFPPACCPSKANGKLMPICSTTMRYGEGCYEKIKESLQIVTNHFKVVMWTALCISLIQVFGIIVAFCLCNAIAEEEEIY